MKLLLMLLFSFVLLLSCNKEKEEEVVNNANSIKIGFLHNFSGTTDRSRLYSMLMAIDEINAKGGVYGRKLELIYDDTKNDTNIIKSKAHDFINKGVVAIVGLNSSTQAIIMAKSVTIPSKIVSIFYLATSPSLSDLADSNTVWRTIPSDAFQGIVAAQYAKSTLNVNNASILYINNTYGVGLANTFKQKFESLGGNIMNFVEVPSATTDFSTYLHSAFNNNPQLLYLVSESAQAASFTNNAHVFLANNPTYIKPLLLGCDGNYSNDKFLPTANIYFSNGFQGTNPSTKTDNANYLRFINNYTAKYGIMPTASYVSQAYDAIYLIAYALLKSNENMIKNGTSKDISRAIAQNLRIVSVGDSLTQGIVINVNEFEKAKEILPNGNINYEGASGSVDFDCKGDVKSGYYSIWEVIVNANKLEYKTKTYIQYP